MTDHDLPVPDPEHVPDAVLDELMAAFAADESVAQDGGPGAVPDAERGYDFDDPSIDRLLGIAPPAEDEPMPEAPAVAAAPRRTIVIPEDDQPDTVYLDEEKEERFRAVHGTGDSERSTVVIGDLDDGTVVEPAPTKGSAGIDPRIRARRIAIRRSEGRRRLVWLGIAAGVVLLLVGAVAVVASPIFDVRTVKVQGAVYTDRDVLDAVIADLEGDPVLLVDTKAVESRLEKVAWVEQARVHADFPHTVTIDIRERQPLATFQGTDRRWRVIDVDGRVLDVIDGQPDAYMLITGTNPDTARGQFAGAPYAAAALLVQSLPGEIRTITQSIGLDATTGTLTMQLKGDVEVRLGDASNLDQKLARLLSQVRSGLEGVRALDVSTAEIGVVPR